MLEQTLLAFDFGMKKMGVAVGQTISKQANPLNLLRAKDGKPNWEELKLLIQIWSPDRIVVGIPHNMDGSEQELSYAARKFGNRIQDFFNLPVCFVDESLTTKEAKKYIALKAPIDCIAAKLILETWFREQQKKV